MKSGLEGRNNRIRMGRDRGDPHVSMKSGLEGRNNRLPHLDLGARIHCVSMKSGLEGRNNSIWALCALISSFVSQ